MTVRAVNRASPQELAEIVEMATLMAREGTAYRHIEPDPHVILQTILGAKFGVVGEVEEELVGFAFGTVVQYTFSQELMATDLGFYVKPGHRGKTIGVQMLKFYIEWAKMQGVREIMIGGSHGFELGEEYPQKLDGIVKRLGFEPAGTWFKMRV